jgi:hypothetical protein
MRLGGCAADAIGANDALPSDGALGGHQRGIGGVEGRHGLGEHFNEHGRPPFNAVYGRKVVVIRSLFVNYLFIQIEAQFYDAHK